MLIWPSYSIPSIFSMPSGRGLCGSMVAAMRGFMTGCAFICSSISLAGRTTVSGSSSCSTSSCGTSSCGSSSCSTSSCSSSVFGAAASGTVLCPLWTGASMGCSRVSSVTSAELSSADTGVISEVSPKKTSPCSSDWFKASFTASVSMTLVSAIVKSSSASARESSRLVSCKSVSPSASGSLSVFWSQSSFILAASSFCILMVSY